MKTAETTKAHQVSLKALPDSLREILSSKKIYFAHMSVGYDMVKGVEQVVQEYPELNLNIRETRDSGDFSKAIFAHSRIGQNRNSKYKMDDFYGVLESGIAQQADLVMLKFCFVDVERKTDVDKLFKDYLELTDKIKKLVPELKVLHCTLPIRIKPNDMKGKLNQFLVRDHNINRNKYNDLLRNHFSEDEIFDLAFYESLNAKGERIGYKAFGKKVFVMNPDFTYDGGHLNEKGSSYIAEKLLVKMSEQFK